VKTTATTEVSADALWKSGDHTLDHPGRVRVVLRRIVQCDPGGIEAVYRFAALIDYGSLLIDYPRCFIGEVFLSPQKMVLQA